jgi:hypothetical protein
MTTSDGRPGRMTRDGEPVTPVGPDGLAALGRDREPGTGAGVVAAQMSSHTPDLPRVPPIHTHSHRRGTAHRHPHIPFGRDPGSASGMLAAKRRIWR